MLPSVVQSGLRSHFRQPGTVSCVAYRVVKRNCRRRSSLCRRYRRLSPLSSAVIVAVILRLWFYLATCVLFSTGCGQEARNSPVRQWTFLRTTDWPEMDCRSTGYVIGALCEWRRRSALLSPCMKAWEVGQRAGNPSFGAGRRCGETRFAVRRGRSLQSQTTYVVRAITLLCYLVWGTFPHFTPDSFKRSGMVH